MDNSLITSIDVIRYAITDRVRELGGNDDTVGEIALAAAYAMWCAACSSIPSR